MSHEDLLLHYAIESGELPGAVVEPEVIEPQVLVEDSAELIESSFESVARGLRLIESLERLESRFCADVSEVSFEAYQVAVGAVLHASGVDIPTSVVCASFESAEKDADASKNKVAKVAKSIVAWVKQMIAKIIELVKGLKTRIMNWGKKRDQDVDKAKEDLKLLKSEGATYAGEKPKAKDGEEKEGGEKTSEKKNPTVKIPAPFVKDGKLDSAGLSSTLDTIKKMIDKVFDISLTASTFEHDALSKATKDLKEYLEEKRASVRVEAEVSVDDLVAALEKVRLFSKSITSTDYAERTSAQVNKQMAEAEAATDPADRKKIEDRLWGAQIQLRTLNQCLQYQNLILNAFLAAASAHRR